MKSSNRQLSNGSAISKNKNDVPVSDEQIETGVYFSKDCIAAVFSYERDDPKVIQAFEGNEDFEIMISSVNGVEMSTMTFSNGLTYDSNIYESQIKSEFMPDISRRGPDFRMPYEIIWTDSATNKILKTNFGYLSPKNTEHLCVYLATKMINKDIVFNSYFVKFENPCLLDMARATAVFDTIGR